MKGKIGAIVAVAVMMGFFILLCICIAMWGSDPQDSSKLMVSTSLLASMLSLFVLAYAALAYRDAESPSERYRAKYRQEDERNKKVPEKK